MLTGKLTKIVATIGPASSDPEVLKQLILNGVNVFRFNMKHNKPEWHSRHIGIVQKIADDLGHSIGIMIDLQGSEIRISTTNEETIELKKDEKVVRLLNSLKTPQIIDDVFEIQEPVQATENNTQLAEVV